MIAVRTQKLTEEIHTVSNRLATLIEEVHSATCTK
jgi:hypothetical protein